MNTWYEFVSSYVLDYVSITEKIMVIELWIYDNKLKKVVIVSRGPTYDTIDVKLIILCSFWDSGNHQLAKIYSIGRDVQSRQLIEYKGGWLESILIFFYIRIRNEYHFHSLIIFADSNYIFCKKITEFTIW